jgi:hypothetical protein
MKKIPSLFARTPDGRNLIRDYNPATLWVLAGPAIATRKWDGTAVRWADGQLWARYDAKRGKPTPVGFVPCQSEPDPITGHFPGWVPATRPEDKWLREAAAGSEWQDGTYEACGPRIGGNAERLASHTMIRHGAEPLYDVPTDYDGLRAYFAHHDIEGVVWWADLGDIDCNKVKITGAALGVERPHPRAELLAADGGR